LAAAEFDEWRLRQCCLAGVLGNHDGPDSLWQAQAVLEKGWRKLQWILVAEEMNEFLDRLPTHEELRDRCMRCTDAPLCRQLIDAPRIVPSERRT